MHLGTAFQLIDDVLDYSGDEQTTGKNLGDDLAEGKPTLPLIHVMQHGDAGTGGLRSPRHRERRARRLRRRARRHSRHRRAGRYAAPGAGGEPGRGGGAGIRCRIQNTAILCYNWPTLRSLAIIEVRGSWDCRWSAAGGFDCSVVRSLSSSWSIRGVAQPGRVLRSGRRSRRFESSHPDQSKPHDDNGAASAGLRRRVPAEECA